MKLITGLLIDPFSRRVRNVHIEAKDLHQYYAALSTPAKEVSAFDVCEIDRMGNTLYIDDEGLFADLEQQQYFTLDGQFFCGPGLIFGSNEDGDTVSATITQFDLVGRLGWPEHTAAVKFAAKLLAAPTIVVFE